MSVASKPPVQQHLDRLDSVFGPEYFEQGRLVVTVARDINGVMKVAHKLQSKINESFGAVAEVIMEHVKHEWWMKLHDTVATVGLHKGEEVADCQVTAIPEGIRVHPYKRDHLPTLEVLLLWEDVSRTTRGHCLFSMLHPEVPNLSQVDEIFAQIEPYFAKRWLTIELRLAPPIRGEFEEAGQADVEEQAHETEVGAGVGVNVLACHAFGFARDQQAAAAHVRDCQPVVFKGLSDSDGRAKVCFLPAEVNKIQVAETDRFYGHEIVLPKADIQSLEQGRTTVKIELTPKALAAVNVYAFALPRILPSAEETDGIIDWAAEERTGLPNASVEVVPLKDGESTVQLRHTGDGAFIADGGLPEGCVSLLVTCPGYEQEERAIMLLVGGNEFYVPMRQRG